MDEASQQETSRAKRITQIGQLEPRQSTSHKPDEIEHTVSQVAQPVAQIGASQVALRPDPRNKNGKRTADHAHPHNEMSPRKLFKRLNFTGDNTYRDMKPEKLASPSQVFVRKEESPSDYYTLSLVQFDLGGMVMVAVTKKEPMGCVHLRRYPLRDAHKVLHWCQRFRHGNIVTSIESYTTRDACIVVYEEMFASLDMLVRSLAYPSSEQLGAIIGQILDALSYVERLGFQFASLNSQSVLLNLAGDVKIMSSAYDQNGVPTTGGADMLKSLDLILLQLTYKTASVYPTESFDEQSPPTSDPVSSRGTLKRAKSATELLQVSLIFEVVCKARPYV